MSINLKDAVVYLLQEGYIYKAVKYLKFTPKAYQELGDLARIAKLEPIQLDWDARYIQFIRDADIPARAEDSRGEAYALNKYSTKGEYAFRKAIGGGIDYDRLVASTKLYYRSAVKLKVAIGRYMEEGLWRSDYDAFAQAEEAGNSSEHVKQQTGNGVHTAWEVG